MYIERLLIINYKSCKGLNIDLSKDDPNILIGINDCGKSTILESIGLLLEERPKFNFIKDDKKKNDISNTPLKIIELNSLLSKCGLPTFYQEDEYIENRCFIIGCFQIEENDIPEDQKEKLSNHLQWVLENSDDNLIWLCREFDGEQSITQDYLLTLDKEDQPLNLFYKKANELSKIKEEVQVSNEDIENENKKGRFKNTELIRAIYSKSNNILTWSKYERKSDKWLFPEYRYLDWNISMEQLNQFTKDIIDTKINNEIAKAKEFAFKRAQDAQSIVNKELQEFTDKFASDLANIEGFVANINFDVASKVTDLFVQKTNSDGPVHLDNQGEGVKRQIWFALIKWRAMESVNEGEQNKKFIWCFDEPETHLYPKAQREFFEIIKKVSTTNVQTILSTHSTVFIDKAKFSNINKIDIDQGYSFFSTCTSIDDIFDSLQLKNSDFLFYDKFLVIEGDTEQILIPHFYKIFSESSLAEDSVQLINLGGKDKVAQNKQVLEEVLGNFRKVDDKIIYIFDNDASFKFTAAQLENPNFNFVGRQDIEDAISSDIWKAIIDKKYGDKVEMTIEEIEAIKESIPNNVEQQSNRKFYPLLIRKLREKLMAANNNKDINYHYDLLPSKGGESGKIIIEQISSIDQIPEKLKEAFEKIKVE